TLGDRPHERRQHRHQPRDRRPRGARYRGHANERDRRAGATRLVRRAVSCKPSSAMRRTFLTAALGLMLASCSTPPATTQAPTPPSPSLTTAELNRALTAARDSMFNNHYTPADNAYRSLLQRAPRSAEAHAQYALFLNYRHTFD